jgi:hypothetical protein
MAHRFGDELLKLIGSANSSRMGEKAKRIAHLRGNQRRVGRHNRAGIIAVPFRFFNTPRFLQSLARDRIDNLIDAYEFIRFGLVWHAEANSSNCDFLERSSWVLSHAVAS